MRWWLCGVVGCGNIQRTTRRAFTRGCKVSTAEGVGETLDFANETERSTEKAEPTEGFFQLLSNETARQPAKPLDFVHSTWPVMQDNVLRYQAILSRDSENHRLAVSRELRAVALCAHGGGVGSEREPKLTPDHVSTNRIVCRYCDVGQSREKNHPSGACQMRSHSHS